MDDELRQFLEGMRQETAARFDEMRSQMETRFGQMETRFGQMETRFGQMETRFGQMEIRFGAFDDRFVEMRRHFETLVDQVNGKIATLAEAMTYFDEKFERRTADIREEMRAGFSETQALIRFGYTDLDRRVRALEGGSNRQ
jgi:DNA anti-recombination protein RmuC